ncbi:cytochrome C biogenesis protein [Candidatus Gracilibacteria bacterium]|nr:cytochrome C biogenesis protein [Candidatus Gracilibacteria bacterium]
MTLLFASFFAGFLTILAPCVLSLLPIILGGSLGETNKWRPLIITLSLAISVIVFTLILKGTTYFISIPRSFWQYFSGGIILAIGFSMLFPKVWDFIAFHMKFYKTETVMGNVGKKEGLMGTILLGAALGPVFSTCSPTYGVIVATILPVSFSLGLIYIFIYAFGLSLPLLAIGYGGRIFVSKLRFAANPNGYLKRGIGLILLLTGLAIITGLDKKVEEKLIDRGYTGASSIELKLIP